MAANDRQEGGDHYKKHRGMEPWDVIIFWGLGFLDGNAVKYLARWRSKNGLEDLKKARHYIDKQIEQLEKFYKSEIEKCQTDLSCDQVLACRKDGKCRNTALMYGNRLPPNAEKTA